MDDHDNNNNDDDHENNSSNKSSSAVPIISVICHAKHPERVRSKWLQARLLRRGGGTHHSQSFHTYRPEWGSVEITMAMIALLRDGLANMAADIFLFVSESCLPVARREVFHQALYTNDDNNYSWVHARNSPNNGYSRQLQFDRVSNAMPLHRVWKADQWMLLTRDHAMSVAKNRLPRTTFPDRSPSFLLTTCFAYVKASDEIYFPTALALLGILRDEEKDSSQDNSAKEKDSHNDNSQEKDQSQEESAKEKDGQDGNAKEKDNNQDNHTHDKSAT